MTAVYITVIIVVALVVIGITTAIRDVALAKHEAAAPRCTHDHNDKENSA